MKNLYIIGNGFDRAHDLPTDYWDFREYLSENRHEFLFDFERMYDIPQYDPTDYRSTEELRKKWEESVKIKLWGTFEEKIGRPNIDEMINKSQCVLNDLDLETGEWGIVDTMNYYWKKEYGFIRNFPRYVKEWIETVNTKDVKPKKKELLFNTRDYFFTFNYTKTLEDVYGVTNVLHIHGCVGEDEIEPIMGHCNKEEIDKYNNMSYEAREAFHEGNQSIYNAISEYLESIYKDTSTCILMNINFFEKLKDVDHVYIFGWSAGPADIPYLRVIRDNVSKNTVWTAYCRSEDSKANMKNVFEKENITSNFTTEFKSCSEFWNI